MKFAPGISSTRSEDQRLLTGKGHFADDLVFDNQAHLSHRAMAAILGAILRLPPLKRAMASGQMGSRYLEKLIEWRGGQEYTA